MRHHPFRFFIVSVILFALTAANAIVFYSNPEDLSKYSGTGLYPENKFTKKVPLNSNWQFRMEGDDEWKDINIPSAYDNYDPVRNVYFRTNFFIGGKKSTERSYKLVFYGINYKCNVKVNDVFVENHSSLNSFEVNLDKNILNFAETNTLIIEVNNKLTKNTIPSEMQVDGWRNYGGIFRDVYLVINSQTFISGADIKYYFNTDRSRVNAEITASITDNRFIKVNEKDTAKYEYTIYSYFQITDQSTGNVVLNTEKKNITLKRYGSENIKFNFEISDPKLWSPNSPALYLCSIYLGELSGEAESEFNRYDITFGFKDLKITGNKFYLNGERFYLKGVSRYEDIKGMGNAVTYSKMKSDIEKIKNLGANVLYCNAFAPHPYLLDLCDKYGIFVLEELPVNSAPAASVRDKNFISQSLEILSDMVLRDRNHASLFGIGFGSGYNVYDLQTVDFIKDLSDRCRELDDELFTFITSEFTQYEEYFKLTDFNIISLTNYLSEPDYRYSVKNISKKASTKPIVISNSLTRVYPKNQNGWADPYSEPAQAKRLLESYGIVTEDENIAGILIDSYRDRRSDVSLLTNQPGDDLHIIRNGLIDYEGSERLSFRVLDALFKSRKAPALAQGEYSPPEVNLYFILGLLLTLVYLYMIKREHYLFVNSLRSVKNSDAFFVDIRDRRVTQIMHSFFIGTLSAYGISAVLSTIFYEFRQDENFDFFLTYFIRNDFLKKYLTYSSWEPLFFVVSGTILILLALLIIASFIKFVSVFFNMRYSYPIAISMVMWNAIVYLPLLPISAVFLRIFTSFTVKFVIILFLIMTAWFILRLFQIMAVSFKTSLSKILWINFLILLVCFLLWTYFFELNINRFSSFFYLIDVLVK
ncbi:MAG TPA: glycoside hydrolase family 2 TIM barrel-domain containing protein [Clostridiales bacterium]|nr:glycoside hydrolase family 2 TIM barrel-domain containing protein [Clostridiales bacterium]HQP70979.1 glycoside hydrolase family 2 TIM barrel-domain containing protein [Clostridiales bacterium]